MGGLRGSRLASGIAVVGGNTVKYVTPEDGRRCVGEWEEGIAGEPATKDLEGTWGHPWRPAPTQKTAWCRRIVIYTELRRLQSNGQSAGAAVPELETLRAGKSMR